MSSIKRIFLGFECQALWPEQWPKGRVIEEKARHVTLAFIGETEIESFMRHLGNFPKPSFQTGFAGIFTKCLFLPKKGPHVVAFEPDLGRRKKTLFEYQSIVKDWLKQHHVPVDSRQYLPHMTIARGKFSLREWEDEFTPLPFRLGPLHLYESLGHSHYRSIWSLPLPPAFEEIEHTADIAFLIRGESLNDIFDHAFIALASVCPDLLPYRNERFEPKSLGDVVKELNVVVGRADADFGVPLKAVSYHGDLIDQEDVFEWEMIVDV